MVGGGAGEVGLGVRLLGLGLGGDEREEALPEAGGADADADAAAELYQLDQLSQTNFICYLELPTVYMASPKLMLSKE